MIQGLYREQEAERRMGPRNRPVVEVPHGGWSRVQPRYRQNLLVRKREERSEDERVEFSWSVPWVPKS